MLTELNRKGGCLCQPARQGQMRCPLIIRPTSEDVVTGNLFQVLKVLNPSWWLPDVLNEALQVTCYSHQVFRNFRIELWQNKPIYPRELIHWAEGSTQVDAVITWENPPTTVYVEMKYGSELSPFTSRNQGQHGFPGDQLVRNARVGLLECGYFKLPRLFQSSPRDFLLLVISPHGGQQLVTRYRDPRHLRSAIPHSQLIPRLPKLPFIGELGFADLVQLLRTRWKCFGWQEKALINHLNEYLEMKLATVPKRIPLEQDTDLFNASHGRQGR
jgi:hypothetical protein